MPPFVVTWLTGKLSGLIIFVVACSAPLFAVAAGYEAVKLHGISVPLPIVGRIELVHGAIADKLMADQARDQALKERDLARTNLRTARANEQKLTAALDTANASIVGLGEKSRQDTAAAQLKLTQERAKGQVLTARLAALDKSRIDTSSPGAAAVSLDALILDGL
jgi:hypothetical protein